MRRALFIILAFVVFSNFFPLQAKVRLPRLLSDNMVIQQGVKFKVWGWADKRERVSVSLDGNTAKTTALDSGSWQCELPAMKGSERALELTVTGTNTLKVKNILVGELWVCAGQSNMAWVMRLAKNGAEEVKNANNPQIRFFLTRGPAAGKPQEDFQNISQWVAFDPKFGGDCTAIGYFFGRYLNKELKVPVGLIDEGCGGTTIEQWLPRSAFDNNADLPGWAEKIAAAEKAYDASKADYDKKYADWKNAPEDKRNKYPPNPIIPPELAFGGIYHCRVSPLLPLAVAGVLWYQGESNVAKDVYFNSQGQDFAKENIALVKTLRKEFSIADLPFLFVQLASVGQKTADPNRTSQYAEAREAQMAALSLPNTAMVSAIDNEDTNTAHPVDKLPIGERLAKAALVVKYKKIVPDYCSPIFDSLKVTGGTLTVKFKHAENGLVVKGEKLKGFAVAGRNKIYFPADAKVSGDSVILTCDKVSSPAGVKYGWANCPDVNLFNKDGMPASPFRAGE